MFVAVSVINALSVASWCVAQISTNRILLDLYMQHSLLWNTLCWWWSLMDSMACFVVYSCCIHVFQS